jgi:hypothetical protein
MAKKDNDLFDRLRQAGVRKQAAKTLSEIGDGASKKALRAAKSAIAELRSLADEIERRLPSGTPGASAISKAVRRTPARSTGAAARPSRARTAGATTRSGGLGPGSCLWNKHRTRAQGGEQGQDLGLAGRWAEDRV